MMQHGEKGGPGLEWGEVLPPHWEARRLKHICEVFPSNVDKKSYEGDTPVLLCNYTDVYYNDRITRELRFMEATATPEQIKRFGLMAGDTIITKDSETADDIAIAAYVPEDLPGVVCGYHLAMVRPKNLTSGAFVKWLFGSRSMKGSVHVRANGLTRVGLGQYALDNLVVPVPPHAEQVAIANFLDRETGKIDALVEEQRRLIELLKEKRQAVISHAVTKGLDPDATMKFSGIGWMGDVPQHWAVCALAYRYEVALGKMLDEKKITGQHLGPYLRNSDVQWGKINTADLPMMDFSGDDLSRYSLAPGDLLVCEGGEVGRAAVWRGELEECFYQKALHRLRPHHADQDDADYLFFVMVAAASSGVFAGSEGKSTIAHLPAEAFRRYQFPFPPKAEQTAIVARLITELAWLDQLIELSEGARALLTERRSALISAAVTGKIDVQREADSVLALSDTARLRAVVAAEIVDLLSHKKSFGRVKLQKLLYLAEADAGIVELQGQYLREAAGPLDRTLIAEVDAGLRQDQHVTVVQSDGPGSQVVYQLRGQRGAYHDELVARIGDRAPTLRALVQKLGDLDTKSIEAVTTLYAVWNDALLDHEEPTDTMVVSGVLEDWHPEKARKFKAEELLTWLRWMRRNKLVPRGNGPRTTTGRLFV